MTLINCYCSLILCVGVFACVMCLHIILTECHCEVVQTYVVVADSGPPPGVCKRSADATSGQDNARVAPTLPPVL